MIEHVLPRLQAAGVRESRRRRAQHRLRPTVAAFLRDASVGNLLTLPIIYSLSAPFVLLDLWVTLYQWICFPMYGIARVSRRTFFVFDRHTLPYLNTIEKAHCVYCSYVTGLIAYVREVTGRTEQYWCPIKHASGRTVRLHRHYPHFVTYGDAIEYRRRLPVLRAQLRREQLKGAQRARARRSASYGVTRRDSK